jgi:hypothetical protein
VSEYILGGNRGEYDRARKMEIKRRVKVFSFGDRNVWEDLGTGYVSKDYIEVTRGEVLTITVRSETDGSIIIQSKVLPDRAYKVQEVRSTL